MEPADVRIELVEQLAALLKIDLEGIGDEFKVEIGSQLVEQFEADLAELQSE